MKKNYKLKNLDCANCAVKLESEICALENVKSASVNYAGLSLTVEYGGNERETLEIIKKTALKCDNIKVLEDGVHNHGYDGARGLISDAARLFIAGMLFAAAVALDVSDSAKNILLILSYAISAHDVLYKASKNIIKGKIFDENFLMSAASIGAIIIGRYAEAAEVMIFYGAGELLQSLAVSRSRKSISKLMDLKPEFARRLENGNEIIIKPEEAVIGDMLLVKAGEKVPVDAEIISGASSFDVRSLTGESVPAELAEGELVLGGSINLSAVVTLRVKKPYSESSAAKIIGLIENSASKKARQESFITRFAKVYTPVVCLLALITAAVPPLFDSLDFAKWVYRALVFLVVSCPCALVVSVPLSFFSGIGMSAKSGILIKGGNYLENLAKATIAVFDKTGTLTKGNFKVVKAEAEKGYEDFANYCAALEKNSNHPLSVAISEAFAADMAASDAQEVPGYGMRGVVNGKKVLCGSLKFMHKENIYPKDPEVVGAKIFTAIDGRFAGVVVIRDEVREGAKAAVEKLLKLGIKKTVMLTGDNEEYAKEIAEKLNISEYHSKLLPQDKVEKIEELQKAGVLIFIGDGINDAPVLAAADAGISMGGVGSDAAVEASDIVIIDDNLEKIPTGIKIARRTLSIVKQNIALAIGVKAAVMALSLFGLASMQLAVFADVGVMLLAIFNSMRNFINVKESKHARTGNLLQ